MHGRGIVHRDVKSENILIDADGYCLLADMGLAGQFGVERGSGLKKGSVLRA
jgi:serine/threonine protein kinase